MRRCHSCRRSTVGGESYLDEGHTVMSWLTTTDHKRIAILYALSITVFFFIGGVAIGLVRLELISPTGLFLTSDEYNRLFTIHGIIMVWFFLVPSIPGHHGKFPAADDDRRAGRGVSAAQSAVVVSLCGRGGVHGLCAAVRRRRYRLDLLPAVLVGLFAFQCDSGRRRRLHRRLFLDRDRRQFHRHDPYAALRRA